MSMSPQTYSAVHCKCSLWTFSLDHVACSGQHVCFKSGGPCCQHSGLHRTICFMPKCSFSTTYEKKVFVPVPRSESFYFVLYVSVKCLYDGLVLNRVQHGWRELSSPKPRGSARKLQSMSTCAHLPGGLFGRPVVFFTRGESRTARHEPSDRDPAERGPEVFVLVVPLGPRVSPCPTTCWA